MLINRGSSYRGKPIPVRFTFAQGQLFLVQGAENIVSLSKSSQVSTATAVHNFYLRQILGMTARAFKLFTDGYLGCHNAPLAYSKVKADYRIDYITHQALGRFLSAFLNRFTENLIHRLQKLEVSVEWLDMEDLWGLFKSKGTPSAIETMCGSSLLSPTPSIADDL